MSFFNMIERDSHALKVRLSVAKCTQRNDIILEIATLRHKWLVFAFAKRKQRNDKKQYLRLAIQPPPFAQRRLKMIAIMTSTRGCLSIKINTAMGSVFVFLSYYISF